MLLRLPHYVEQAAHTVALIVPYHITPLRVYAVGHQMPAHADSVLLYERDIGLQDVEVGEVTPEWRALLGEFPFIRLISTASLAASQCQTHTVHVDGREVSIHVQPSMSAQVRRGTLWCHELGYESASGCSLALCLSSILTCL
jgi:hypothetical protein